MKLGSVAQEVIKVVERIFLQIGRNALHAATVEGDVRILHGGPPRCNSNNYKLKETKDTENFWILSLK